MNTDQPDCIGPGIYYKLVKSEPAIYDSEPQTDSESARRPPSPQSETRFDPATGEAYSPPSIISDLNHSDWYIRMRAAWVIGKTRDVAGIVALIDALNDEHKEVRDRAQEALRAVESADEPLPVRILLCRAVDDAARTDMLLAVTDARATRGALYGFGSVKAYCEHWLEEDASGMNVEEQAVLAGLKRAAAAVLNELANRNNSHMLLRPGDANNAAHQSQLLRSSEPGLRPGDDENLLLASSREDDRSHATQPDSPLNSGQASSA